MDTIERSPADLELRTKVSRLADAVTEVFEVYEDSLRCVFANDPLTHNDRNASISTVLASLPRPEAAVVYCVYDYDYSSAFVLKGGRWVHHANLNHFRSETIPAWVPIEAMPFFVRVLNAARDEARDEGYAEGRRHGQDAMRNAIRGLIGAAPLVELETD